MRVSTENYKRTMLHTVKFPNTHPSNL